MQSCRLILKNYGRLMQWKKPGVNQMLLVMTKKPVSTFFMIAQRKVPEIAEVFVMITKLWRKEKNINQKTVLLIWQPTWELKFYQKKNTEHCRNLEISIRKHRVG